MKKSLFMMLAAFVIVLTGCGSNGNGGNEPAQPKTEPAAGATDNANAGSETPAERMYIPIISKGFQHQFWQAVKLGAEKAAGELNVEITFEGPETESQVDKQTGNAAGCTGQKTDRNRLRCS